MKSWPTWGRPKIRVERRATFAHPANAADALADRLDVGLEVAQPIQGGPRDRVRDALQLRIDGALQPRQLAVEQPGCGAGSGSAPQIGHYVASYFRLNGREDSV